jgi:hypothetical protein
MDARFINTTKKGQARALPAERQACGEIDAMLTRELKPVLVVLDQAQAFLAAQKRSVN